MKQFFCIFLAGMLTWPLAGCDASNAVSEETPPQAVNDSLSAEPEPEPEKSVSARIAETYRICLETEEAQLYALSERIDALPVQPRPATDALQEDFHAYVASLEGIYTQLESYDEQAQDDLSDGDLEQEDYEAIVFQLDQLAGRVHGLKDTLYVVYGMSGASSTLEPAA